MNCGPASRAWCFPGTATGSCAPPAPGHGLGRIRDLTVTSLVTSQHQRHADLRESGIWILASCAPGKSLPPGPQQACDLREQHSGREPAMKVPGQKEAAGASYQAPDHAPELGKQEIVELRGLEPLASCMPYKLQLSLGVAGRGPVWRSPAASVAVCGLASPGAAPRWLPTWLPQLVSSANVRGALQPPGRVRLLSSPGGPGNGSARAPPSQARKRPRRAAAESDGDQVHVNPGGLS